MSDAEGHYLNILMHQVIDSLTELARGPVSLSMSHLNKLPQQNQEEDVALLRGLPVKLHAVLLHW